MDVKVGLQRKMSTKGLMLLNCGAGEKALESPLDCKEIQSVYSKGKSVLTGRADAAAETPILWLPDAKN